MLFLTRENKIHIFKPTCNVFFSYYKDKLRQNNNNRNIIWMCDVHTDIQYILSLFVCLTFISSITEIHSSNLLLSLATNSWRCSGTSTTGCGKSSTQREIKLRRSQNNSGHT